MRAAAGPWPALLADRASCELNEEQARAREPGLRASEMRRALCGSNRWGAGPQRLYV